MKHTPGENHCRYCGDLSWTISHYGRRVHKESCPTRGDDLLHQGNIYRMIAAAPDLLDAGKARIKALENLLVCYRIGKRPTEKLHDRLDQSRSSWENAIAKAEGGG